MPCRRARRPAGAWRLGAAVLGLVLAFPGGSARAADGATAAAADSPCLILSYHRFGPVVADAMTVTTATFRSQLQALADGGYSVVPLRRLVEHRHGAGPALPPRAVVITVDDAHRSLRTEMLPLVQRFGVPVTLFVYPSAIGRADYALTWDEIRALRDSRLFDVQSHTYWHPNFRTEARRLAPAEYARFVKWQLEQSRARLATELGTPIDMLAWPFGIYDRPLMAMAAAAGYVAAVTLEGRAATERDDLLALPRHLVSERDHGASFAHLLAASVGAPGSRP